MMTREQRKQARRRDIILICLAVCVFVAACVASEMVMPTVI